MLSGVRLSYELFARVPFRMNYSLGFRVCRFTLGVCSGDRAVHGIRAACAPLLPRVSFATEASRVATVVTQGPGSRYNASSLKAM